MFARGGPAANGISSKIDGVPPTAANEAATDRSGRTGLASTSARRDVARVICILDASIRCESRHHHGTLIHTHKASIRLAHIFSTCITHAVLRANADTLLNASATLGFSLAMHGPPGLPPS